jgi:hypothetical protein
MDATGVNRWLQAYVDAWKTYGRDEIGALFSEDVEYRYHPYDDPIRGRDAVIESWLGEGDHPEAPTPDPEGTYDATYRAVAVDGDVAVATGRSTYVTEPGGEIKEVFHNCFVMRFDDTGRCSEFTEWFIEEPR